MEKITNANIHSGISLNGCHLHSVWINNNQLRKSLNILKSIGMFKVVLGTFIILCEIFGACCSLFSPISIDGVSSTLWWRALNDYQCDKTIQIVLLHGVWVICTGLLGIKIKSGKFSPRIMNVYLIYCVTGAMSSIAILVQDSLDKSFITNSICFNHLVRYALVTYFVVISSLQVICICYCCIAIETRPCYLCSLEFDQQTEANRYCSGKDPARRHKHQPHTEV